MSIVAEMVENKALEMVISQAQNRARDFLCRDCLDKRCHTNSPCKAFAQISKGYAWEIAAEKAEVN